MIGETIRTEFEALKNDFETIRQQIEDDVVRTELYKGEFYELTPYSYQRNGCKQGKPVKRPDTIKSTKNLFIYGFNNQNQIVEVKAGCSIENQFYHTFLYYTDNLVRSLLYDNCKHLMKDRNKIVRDKKLTEEEKIAKLIETGMTEKAAQGLIVPDVCNDIGYAACYLTNNSATIRNAKKRLERVKRLKSQEEKTYEVNGIRVVENPQENRFQIFFVKKPAEEIRQKLQHVGYRYSYGNGCWQCYLKRWNIEAGKQILMSLGND